MIEHLTWEGEHTTWCTEMCCRVGHLKPVFVNQCHPNKFNLKKERKFCLNAEEHFREKKAPVQSQKSSSALKVPQNKSCHSDWKPTKISQTIHKSPRLHLATIPYWAPETCLPPMPLNSGSFLGLGASGGR